MPATTGRMLNREALHERHRQIIRVFTRGRNKAVISRDMGVSYSAVYRTIWRYKREGAGTLALEQRSVAERQTSRAHPEVDLGEATGTDSSVLQRSPCQVRCMSDNGYRINNTC